MTLSGNSAYAVFLVATRQHDLNNCLRLTNPLRSSLFGGFLFRERDSVLIPNFSIRWLLGVTTSAAFFFLIVNFARAGHTWAFGVSAAIVFALLLFVFFALMFSFSYWMTRLTRFAQPKPKPISPFATETLPPQIIPPVNHVD
ncbi:hypothetical protein ACFL2H_12335 [Planctomycetota bacterium]